MPDQKITDLTAAGSLTGTELVEAVQSGANVKTTTAAIAALATGGHVIEDEGTPVTQRANMNFVGAGVSVADAGGKTVVTISGASVTPAALTKTDDTNVTVTLGGTPASALLQAVSLTLGWTGTLAASRGGTGLSALGTGVATALGVNVGSAGAPVVNGGALGTPSSGTGTNLTGIPESGVTNLVTDLAAKAPLASPTFTGTPAAPTAAAGTNTTQIATTAFVQANGAKVIMGMVTDDVSAIAAGTGKRTFRMPFAMTVTAVRCSLRVAQASGSIFTVDINETGTTILSTKLTIDNTELTSTTAATPAVISDSALADDAQITIDVDQIGDGTAIGLSFAIIGF